MVQTPYFHYRGTHSISDWETKIPQTLAWSYIYICTHCDSMYIKSQNRQSYYIEISTAGLDGNTIKKSKDVIAIKVIFFYSITSGIGRWKEIMMRKGHKITFQGSGGILLLVSFNQYIYVL